MSAHYATVSGRAGHRCEYCHAPEAVFNFPFEVEHAVPVSKNGSDDEVNKALACRSCNLFKSDHMSGFDAETGQEVSLYHPRRDEWSQHFRFDSESAEIIGLTAVGRATIARLRMNSPLQVAARRMWAKLGLL